MENRTPVFGGSASMPMMQLQIEEQNRRINGGVANEAQYLALQHSPGFQEYRNQAASIWSPNGNTFSSSLTSTDRAHNIQGAGSENSSSSNDTSMRPDFHVKGSSLTLITSGSLDSETPTIPEQTNGLEKASIKTKLSSASLDYLRSADSSVFEADRYHRTYVSAGPSPGNSPMQEPESPSSSFPSAGSTLVNHGRTFTECGEDSYGCKTPKKDWLCGLEHRSPVTDKTTPPKDLHAPGGFLHHRQTSSRLSSLPAIPSPLGPKHPVDDPDSAVSSLVSPVPASPSQELRYKTNVQKTPQKLDLHALKVLANSQGSAFYSPNGTKVSGLVSPLPASLRQGRYNSYEKKVERTSQKLDLHSLKVGTNRNGSTYHASNGFGIGHSRNITDPFVENAESADGLPMPSPFVTQARKKFKWPSSSQTQVPATPDFQSSGSPTTRADDGNASTPIYQGFILTASGSDLRVPATPAGQSTTPTTPSFETFNNAASRVDLPIPPPPLSSTQGHFYHTPQARARLDTQAAIRADWIRTEAKKIADLSRLSFTAARQYNETGLQEDYERWQKFSSAYGDATDLEKRQEERRNLFMPQGVRAMKTDVEDDAINGGQEESKLLSFQMAYMERVCAEVKRQADEKKEKDDGEGEISTDMLETLSLAERKELRKHLVARLEAVADRRR